MKLDPIRKFIRNLTGFDVHHHVPPRDRLAWLMSFNIQTVIDVGANEGQTASEMRARFPQADIYSFEPLPDCYSTLTRVMKGDTRFKSWNIGAGDNKTTTTIHRNPFSQSSSILDMEQLHRDTFPESRGDEQNVTIKIDRLDDVLKVSELKKNILFKIDVQGYEDKAIRGSEQILRATKAVLIENSFMSLYKGQPLFADIYKMLVDLGFTYRGSLWQKLDPKTGAVMFEDSLFVRE
ncbi:MAG TPA: FkbM family methyltransferase [Candidatus Paceibacterota bacterium]